MLKPRDFSYNFPCELIAHSPTRERDHSRLLILDRRDGSISHTKFFDLPNLLDTNTVIVRNNTKVLKARLFGYKLSGGKVEILLNKKLAVADKTADPYEYWECLTKPGLKPGTSVKFADTDLTAECIPEAPDKSAQPSYTRLLRFSQTGNDFLETLDRIGHTPLPPYIKSDDLDKTIAAQYQTTFARVPGSVAAPTAGLHLTTELENTLKNKGIQILDLTLHVGLGTFLPVKINDISKHYMHSEWYELSEQTASELNKAKAQGKKILGIGTTSVRTLETVVAVTKDIQHFSEQSGDTNIFIYPPYQFKAVDQLITNFHLPESTLLMLVSAFTSHPQTNEHFTQFSSSLLGKAYQEAIDTGYKFYSFGDAMLIL